MKQVREASGLHISWQKDAVALQLPQAHPFREPGGHRSRRTSPSLVPLGINPRAPALQGVDYPNPPKMRSARVTRSSRTSAHEPFVPISVAQARGTLASSPHERSVDIRHSSRTTSLASGAQSVSSKSDIFGPLPTSRRLSTFPPAEEVPVTAPVAASRSVIPPVGF